MKRSLLVGERGNEPRVPRLEELALDDVTAWLEVSTEQGAFVGDTRSWAKLALIGVNVGTCRALNLLPPAPQGEPWGKELAAACACEIVGWAHDAYDTVYLCGKRVAAAFGLRGPGIVPGYQVWDGGSCRWEREWIPDAVRYVVLPHPSGLNRFWNDREAVRRLHEELTRS